MMSKDWEDIKVNKRDSSKVVFESPLVQSIYDGIDHLKQETTEILKEMDTTEFKQNLDEFDIEEFGENTLDQFSDIAHDLSKFKDEVMEREEVPGFVRQYSKDAKIALNRDEEYLRRAKRKLNRIDSNRFSNEYNANIRVVELCDKSIKINDSNYEAYYIKGIALTNLEEYSSAIDEFINSLVLNEDFIDARLAIANANRLNGDFNDAINVYDSVLKIEDESFEAFKGKAYTYYDWEKYGQASIFFEKASLITPLDEESVRIWDECLQK